MELPKISWFRNWQLHTGLQGIRITDTEPGTSTSADLDVVGEVLVLHGEVHGPLQALVAGVHHLPRQPRQRLLDVQVVVRVVQVVVPEPCAGDSKGRTDQGRRRRA